MDIGEPDAVASFGEWVQRRRRMVALTQTELAQKVGCAVVTIKKIEQDGRKPSRQIAVLLAKYLAVPDAVRDDFLNMAQGKFVPGAQAAKDRLAVPAFLQPGKDPAQKMELGFVERQSELARLAASLDQALAGLSRPVFILGDAGSGKTTLMAEFARQAQKMSTDLLVAGGQCNAQTGVGDPYRPFRDILGMFTGDLQSSWLAGEISREQALRLWMSIPDNLQAITNYGPGLGNSLIPVGPFLRRVTPYLAGPADWLDRFQSSSRLEQPGIIDFNQNQVLEEVTRVFQEVAARHPLLLLIDDLQWVDDASINLLFHFCRRLSGSRILMVGAFRPDENSSRRENSQLDSNSHPIESLVLELARQYGEIQLNLNRANPAVGKAFVNAIIDRDPNLLGEAFRETIFRYTQGHPLFTVEMLWSMRESGKLVQDRSGRWIESDRPGPYPMPARVEAVIAQRLKRLVPGLEELLGVASVEGQVFTAEVVAKILNLDLKVVLERLSRDLGQQHRLVQEQGEVQVGKRTVTRFQFRHLLFQEHLYARFSPGEKRRLHRKFAFELEEIIANPAADQPQMVECQELERPDELDQFGPGLAHHFLLGEVWEKAAEYALQMGKKSIQRYAMREAIAYFESALDAMSHLADPPAVRIFTALLGWEEAAFKFRPYQEQLAQLSRAEEIARQLQDKPRLIQVLHWTANVYLARGLWTSAGPSLTECLALAEELENEQLLVRPIYYKALMTSFADPKSALLLTDRSIELAQKYHDLTIEAIAFGTKGQVQAQLGEFVQSMRSVETARQVADRLGSPLVESDVDLLAAWSFLAMGRIEQGLVFGQRSVEKAIATDNMDCLCNGLACVGYGNLELGRIPEAVAAFEKGIERSEVSGAMIPKLNGQAGLAMAQFFTGRKEAIEDLQSVVKNMHLFDNEVGAANANQMLGRCLLQMGAYDQAESYLADAIGYYSQAAMLPSLVKTLAALSDLLEKMGRDSDAENYRHEAEVLSKSILTGEDQL